MALRKSETKETPQVESLSGMKAKRVFSNTEKEKEEELQRIENEAEPSLANSDVAVGVVFLE